VLSLSAARAPRAKAAPATCGAGGCAVTVDARDFTSGDPLASFTYIVNVDNTKLPNDPLALNTESNSPIVRVGDQDRRTVNLPDGQPAGRTIPDLGPLAGSQDVGCARHPATRRRG
jgi:hypothetical protein